MKSKQIALLRKLVHFMSPLKVYLYLAVTCAVLGFVVTLSIPALIIYLIFNAQDVHYWSALLLIGLGLCRGVFRYGEHYFGHYIAFRVLANFRNLVFEKLRHLAPAKLDSKESGVLLKMIGEDIEAIEIFFAHTLPPLLTASCIALALFIYFAVYSWSIAMIATITYIVLSIVLPIHFAKSLQPIMTKHQQLRKIYMGQFLDTLKGMSDLNQYQQTNKYFQNLQQKSHEANEKEREMQRKQYQQTISTFFVVGLSILCIALIALYAVQQQAISLEAGIMVVVVFSTSFAPFLELSRLPFGLKKALKAARDVFELLEEPEMSVTGTGTVEKVEQVTYDKVTFSYPQREIVILDELSVAFENKRIIGIMGESGSGKSTLMKLLMRWYDVQEGTVSIDRQSVNTLNRRRLQAKIAYIPQKPQLFSQTLRENLVLQKEDVTDDMIFEVAEKCQMKQRLLDLPQGLDTILNQEQLPFSSGEMQRLELMRALLTNATCYIFDEPTSYLDSLNEALFLKIVKEHCQGQIFLISHRSSTLAVADVVYRIQNQKIIKEGD